VIRLSILGPVWDRLSTQFASNMDTEEGGFLLARATATPEGLRVVIDGDVPFPAAEKWRLQNSGQLAPTTAYMSLTAGVANQRKRIPAFVHTHPFGPAHFSPVDEWAFEAWAPFFEENCDSGAFIAIVVAGDTLIADMWVGADRKPFQSVTCGGSRPRLSFRLRPGTQESEETDRQRRLWKDHGQSVLRQARIGIVGVGGTGSACAFQLARTDVGEMVLFDPQSTDISNLNRLYGLTKSQAARGIPKVSVVGNRVRQISSTRVVQHRASILKKEAISSLLDCDVIIGCTDSQSARAVLNQIPTSYGVPVIDVGCRAESHEGEVLSMWADVRRLESGGPCLWCMGAIDSESVALEGLPPQTREQGEKDGYYRGVGIEPSTVTMTTSGATLAVSQVLARVLNQDSPWPHQFLFDIWSGTSHIPTIEKRPNCICSGSRWSISMVAPIELARAFNRTSAAHAAPISSRIRGQNSVNA